MPVNSTCNKDIAEQVRCLSQNHGNREYEINDFSTSYEIPSQVESSVTRHPEVHGGSGFAAATVADLGFEPTLGATSPDAKPRRARKNTIEVGEGLSAAGVSATGVSTAVASGGGVSAGAAQRARRKKGGGVSGGALLSLRPRQDARTTSTRLTGQDNGGGRR